MVKNDSQPSIIIPVEDAGALFKDYEYNRISLIESKQNTDSNGNRISSNDKRYIKATRSVTIDYEQLKEYLYFIEEQAAEAETEIKGLRIYFGKYPDSGRFPTGNACKYPGAETVFMNPTMMHEKDEVSFAIATNRKGGSQAIPVGEILNTSKKGDQYGEETRSLAGNTFTRIPPPDENNNDFH